MIGSKSDVMLAVLLWLLLATPAAADSLFSEAVVDGDRYEMGLYGEHVPLIEVGDILKVRIRERTNATVDTKVDTKDETKTDAQASRSGGLLGQLLDPVFDLIGAGNYAFDSGNEYKGEGGTDRSVRLEGIVTVLVVDVQDNGQAVIEGRKNVLVNREAQTMVVRGVIDPRDLDEDMIVDSDYVADVEIEYIGEGQLSKKHKPGFLSRVLDAIF